MLSGDNGLLTKVGQARDDSIVGQEKEQVELAYISATVKKSSNNIDETDLQTELNSSVGNLKTTVSSNGNGILNVNFTDTKHNYTVGDGSVTRIADGEIEVVPQGKVARIGTTYYESLQDAFDEVPTTNSQTEVVLLANISENVLVVENQNIVLNLNNKTITNIEGTADAGDWSQAVIEIRSTGTIEIKNGNIESIYGGGIENYGTAEVNNVNVASRCVLGAILNSGTLTINSGNFSADNEEGNQINIWTYGGTLNINGGVFNSNTDSAVNIEGAANVYITGGTFTGGEGNSCVLCCDGSILRIDDGTFTSTSGYAVSLSGGRPYRYLWWYI